MTLLTCGDGTVDSHTWPVTTTVAVDQVGGGRRSILMSVTAWCQHGQHRLRCLLCRLGSWIPWHQSRRRRRSVSVSGEECCPEEEISSSPDKPEDGQKSSRGGVRDLPSTTNVKVREDIREGFKTHKIWEFPHFRRGGGHFHTFSSVYQLLQIVQSIHKCCLKTLYFYRSLSEEDISHIQNQRIEKQFQSVETQTDHSEKSLIIKAAGNNTERESERERERRILYGSSREIRNIYCKNYDRPLTFQEFKLFSYKRRNYQIDLKNSRGKFNTLV